MSHHQPPAETPPEITQQEQLLPFLLNPSSYPHRPRSVRLVQTHSSFVFIAPPFVYKIKKPVNFGFLDFSTLEKRRHFCEREVVLNRRLTSRVYLGVVSISLREGRFCFGESKGEGTRVVEYAVKMRKLSDRHFLDAQLERHAVGPVELDRIATTLKEFYAGQHPTAEVESWGQISKLRISTEENFRQLEPFVDHTLSRPAFETLREATDRFYRSHTALFESRIRDKCVRDCHGDLHLEHIHLTPRTVNIYDCIEFNDRFRYVDVANDVAFLAMDLDFRGRSDLARHFVTTMSARLADDGLLALMDFYKTYRAIVRGKVESLHSVAHAAPEAERTASAERARRYFRLALHYVISGSRPEVLVVMGRIASGKSTVAQALAGELGWNVYSSDRVRKETAGFPLFERTGDDARRRLYSTSMTEQTYDQLFTLAEAEIAAGRSVILDATFGRRALRDRLMGRLKGQCIRVRFLEVQADDTTVKRRLRQRETSSVEVSDARLEDFTNLTGTYEPPMEVAAGEHARVLSRPVPTETLTEALRALSRLQVDSDTSSVV